MTDQQQEQQGLPQPPEKLTVDSHDNDDDDDDDDDDEDNNNNNKKPEDLGRGKREKKVVDRLIVKEKQKEEFKILPGKGKRLAEIPNINYHMSKITRSDDALKEIHRMLYGRGGKQHTIKANILEFSGVAGGAEEEKKCQGRLARFTISGLKYLLELFDLPRSGTKDELTERVWSFLLSPAVNADSGDIEKREEKKKQKKQRDKNKTPRKKRAKTDNNNNNNNNNNDDDDDDDDEDDEEEEEEEKKKEKEELAKDIDYDDTPKVKKRTRGKNKKKENPNLPGDDIMKQKINEYVDSVEDKDKITLRMVKDELHKIFSCDVEEKKDFIRRCVQEKLQ